MQLLLFAIFILHANSQVYYKFPDLIKCRQFKNPNHYFMFWLNDYADTYAYYQYNLGAQQYSGIYFDGEGRYASAYGTYGTSAYCTTCMGKSLQELKQLNWTFTMENSQLSNMSIIIQTLSEQSKTLENQMSSTKSKYNTEFSNTSIIIQTLSEQSKTLENQMSSTKSKYNTEFSNTSIIIQKLSEQIKSLGNQMTSTSIIDNKQFQNITNVLQNLKGQIKDLTYQKALIEQKCKKLQDQMKSIKSDSRENFGIGSAGLSIAIVTFVVLIVVSVIAKYFFLKKLDEQIQKMRRGDAYLAEHPSHIHIEHM